MPHNRPVHDHDNSSEQSLGEPPDAGPDAGTNTGTDADAEPATMPTDPPRRATRLRVGYRADEVDAFLAELLAALDREPPGMAPYEVADARFRATYLRRRYRMQSVDEYLERAQRVLRDRHGHDAVADVEGHLSTPRHVPTGWIYGIALVLVAAMLVFAVLQVLA
jgi:hypothetical protein